MTEQVICVDDVSMPGRVWGRVSRLSTPGLSDRQNQSKPCRLEFRLPLFG